jgi:hypothetical protein
MMSHEDFGSVPSDLGVVDFCGSFGIESGSVPATGLLPGRSISDIGFT